jgi:hypothetical protein
VLRAAKLVADERRCRVFAVSDNYAQLDALLAYLTENCCAGNAACAPVAACRPPAKARRK